MNQPPIPDDVELVEAVQQGRLDAFSDLYERYFPVVFRRVRCVVPTEDVEDVTQEIFCAVIRSIHSFRFEARFNTWLRTLVNRQVADYYRNRHPQDTALELPTDQDGEYLSYAYPAGETDRLDDEIILLQALQKLPKNYQEVIQLRFAEGLPFEEIGRLQGYSLEATKSLYRRAIGTLHRQVTHE